jgi:hypothetical protein
MPWSWCRSRRLLHRRPSADFEVDLLDVLSTPLGLVRAGVAPDHPKFKSVTRRSYLYATGLFSRAASDFPAASGSTTKTRCWSGTSIFVKLRQFAERSRVTPRTVFESCSLEHHDARHARSLASFLSAAQIPGAT